MLPQAPRKERRDKFCTSRSACRQIEAGVSQKAGRMSRAIPEKKGLAPIDVSPFVSRCRRQDLNLHSLDGNQVLNLTEPHLFYMGLAGHLGGKPLFCSKKRQIGVGVAGHTDGRCMSPNVSDLCQIFQVTPWACSLVHRATGTG
jgi:hypothetical protein